MPERYVTFDELNHSTLTRTAHTIAHTRRVVRSDQHEQRFAAASRSRVWCVVLCCVATLAPDLDLTLLVMDDANQLRCPPTTAKRCG